MLPKFVPPLLLVAGICVAVPTLVNLIEGNQTDSAEPAQAAAAAPVLHVDPFATTLPPTTAPTASAAKHPATQPATPVVITPPPPVAKSVDPPAAAVQPVADQSPKPSDSFNTLCSEVHQTVIDHSYQCSAIVGGAFAQNTFEDVCPNGVLVGLRLGMGKFMGNDVIKFIQPIYRTPAGLCPGRAYGKDDGLWREWTAPPGYAIGALRIRGGGGLDAVTISVMSIDGMHLNPNHTDLTPRIGGTGGGEGYVGGDGTPIIGICGRYNSKDQYLGLGAVFLHSTLTANAR